jgi:hypothetical protein
MLERFLDIGRIGPVERDRAPHAEGITERERALVVCLEQRQRLRAR